MSRDDWKGMTRAQKGAAVAARVGWVFAGTPQERTDSCLRVVTLEGMHDAESRILDGSCWLQYCAQLAQVCWEDQAGKRKRSIPQFAVLAHATADQRAEAFCIAVPCGSGV